MKNSSNQHQFGKTLIIGLGLIGGSFAKGLKNKNLSQEIYAFDPNSESIELALAEGIITKSIPALDTISDENFDLIVIASPLKTYKEIFTKISKAKLNNSLIIDLGSLKSFINKILPAQLQENFVACHPIAGSEKNGFENSDAEIFHNKKFIICSNSKNNSETIKKADELAKKLGFVVEKIDAKAHDDIYALVSHLPQFLSFLFKEFSPEKIEDKFFAKTFRLENSDPEIWSDIFKINEQNIEKYYLEFFDNFELNLKTIVEKSDFSKAIETINSLAALQNYEEKFDEEFFTKNFAVILFRAVAAISLLEIKALKEFQNYAGSGFNDFVSIIYIFKFEPEKLLKLIAENRSKILKIFKSLS